MDSGDCLDLDKDKRELSHFSQEKVGPLARKKSPVSGSPRERGILRAKVKFWAAILITMAVTGGALYYYYSSLITTPRPYQAVFRLNITLTNPDNTSQVKGAVIPPGIGVISSLWRDHTLDKLGVDGRAPIYTLDSTGIIRIQSTARENYTLSDFFNIWGHFFNGTCLEIDKLYCDTVATGNTWLWGFFANGPANQDYGAYVIKDQDILRLSYAPVG